MDKKSKKELINKIKPYINEEVRTLWGPATVIGFVEDNNGEVIQVELKEFNEESFVVEVEQFFECLQ